MPTPAEATVVLREKLLARCWPTSIDVDHRSGGCFANNGQWAADRRDAGELLGVLSASERTYRHPDFQFDKQGQIRPKVKALLSALALREEFHNTKDQDKSGWRRTFWLYGATFTLAGSDGNVCAFVGQPLVRVESNLERLVVKSLAMDAACLAIATQPVTMCWTWRGVKRRYTPDVLVIFKELPGAWHRFGMERISLVEVKPTSSGIDDDLWSERVLRLRETLNVPLVRLPAGDGVRL
jgi:hypothetical protein